MADTTPQSTPVPPLPPIDLDAPLAVVVVGADPHAEVFDRPIARLLIDSINAWAGDRLGPSGRALPASYCISDLWYLNNSHLRMRPTISIGSPEVNAMSALIIGRVPPVFAVQDQYAVHSEPELEQLVACCWGTDGPRTLAAVEYFTRRNLHDFLDAAAAAV